MGKVVDPRFFLNDDVLSVSRDLLGKCLMTNIDDVLTGGIITETEAYRAPEDKASHAYKGRRTKRNEAMFLRGGRTYVYLCYGIHALLNIVSGEEGIPHAILIRAIEPTVGIAEMKKRRMKNSTVKDLTTGPGSLSKALGITLEHNNLPMPNDLIWIEESGLTISPLRIIASPRIGISYAGEYAEKPWRFRISASK